MRIGLHLYSHAPFDAIPWLALGARLGGLDSLTVWDHYQHFIPRGLWNADFSWLARHTASPHGIYDPWTLLGYLARHAGGLRLGVLVTAPSRRHPVALAQAALSLANMTRRAPILGLGLGERENTVPYGHQVSRPVDQFAEAVQVIRHCLTAEGPFDYAGEHFQLRNAVMDLNAPPRRVPELWIAAHGPRMLRLAGIHGDGWIPHIVFPDEYAEKLAIVRRAASDAGRDPATITPSNEMLVAVARSERKARDMLATRAGRFSALLMPSKAWKQLGAEHPLGADFGGFATFIPEQESIELLEEALERVPVEIVAAFTLWGTPDQVVTRLRQFAAAGARHVALVPAAVYVERQAALWTLAGLRRIRRELQ